MKQEDLKERTIRFALNVTALCRRLQNDWPQRRVSDQLFRSATSVAANYHAASRARSRREFQAKLGIVAEEAEETAFWLEFARRARMIDEQLALPVCAEARELLAIFIASLKTVAAGMRGSTSIRD
ncbi:MAG TPA: four helix bundle protein [Vicinamibacterales bacterium]|nr:four helix bundle protein [Vicinamibacterales bacterium]